MTGLSLREVKLLIVFAVVACFGMVAGVLAMLFVVRLADIAAR